MTVDLLHRLRVVVTRPRLRVLVGVILVLDMGSEAFDRLGHKFFLDNGGVGDDSLVGLGVLFLVLALRVGLTRMCWLKVEIMMVW